MYLVQVLLPLHNNEGQSFPSSYFTAIRKELTELFGGVTAFIRSPAEGLWKDDTEGVTQEQIIMFEVLVNQLDEQWWRSYRIKLQDQFRQEELLIWASEIKKL